jgi:hypothetical protein
MMAILVDFEIALYNLSIIDFNIYYNMEDLAFFSEVWQR